MPSINEVWEQALQINANLVVLHHDVDGLEGIATNQLHELEEHTDWLEAIHVALGDGFANIAANLAGLQARIDLSNAMQRYQILQNQTVICLLEKIARNTCDILTEEDQQTRLQQSIAGDVDALRHMEETVHPDAALVLQRAVEARKAVERCCPPPKPVPRCSFEPCAKPPELDVKQPTREVESYVPVKRARKAKSTRSK